MEDWFQDLPQIIKPADAQVPWIKWCGAVGLHIRGRANRRSTALVTEGQLRAMLRGLLSYSLRAFWYFLKRYHLLNTNQSVKCRTRIFLFNPYNTLVR